MNSTRSICLISAGHITTCPRMMKAAEAFHEQGYNVRIVCSSYVRWLDEADASFLASRGWQTSVVRFDRETHSLGYYWTGIRHRLARQRVRLKGVAKASMEQLGAAFTRPYFELVRLAAAMPADLYYAGTSGGVGIAAEVARHTGRPYALDLEDFHSAEQDPSDTASFEHEVIGEIERRVLRIAKFLTCGSEPMAAAYAQKYGVTAAPIHNVFSLPRTVPDFDVTPGRLRVVWLSQTVGRGRGIEDAILALGIADRPADLMLRGKAVPGYLDGLVALARAHAPKVTLRHAEPDMSRSVVDLCRGYDVGLALEQTRVLNREVCLCNKPFTYLLAGLAVAFTDTEGQRSLAKDLGRGALLFKVGDVQELAKGLRHWADHSEELATAKRTAWQAAVRRWHWEHPKEKGRLLDLVRCTFAD